MRRTSDNLDLRLVSDVGQSYGTEPLTREIYTNSRYTVSKLSYWDTSLLFRLSQPGTSRMNQTNTYNPTDTSCGLIFANLGANSWRKQVRWTACEK